MFWYETPWSGRITVVVGPIGTASIGTCSCRHPPVSHLSPNYTENKLCGKPPQYAPPLQVDLWPFDLESGVRVTCDVGYLCANFSLPGPLCSQLRSDVRDRQTDVSRASSLHASALWGAGHNKYVKRATVFLLCVFASGQIQYCQVLAWNWCFSAKIDSLLLTQLQCIKYQWLIG